MKLYVIATPIGNLGDITFRAVETLKEVDFLACEDTRVSVKILNYFDIKKPMISYHEHNKKQKGQEIIERIKNGESCGLITDAGTPAISDPGEDIVSICYENGIDVVPIPGVSAVISALSVSGQPTSRFTFEGFLSQNKKERNEHLTELKTEKRTMVFYEAPHKLKKTLQDFVEVFGDRDLTICREITKKFEEYTKTSLVLALESCENRDPRGEYVLVIRGAENICEMTEEELMMQAIIDVEKLMEVGVYMKDAVKMTAESLKISKNTLYKIALEKLKD